MVLARKLVAVAERKCGQRFPLLRYLRLARIDRDSRARAGHAKSRGRCVAPDFLLWPRRRWHTRDRVRQRRECTRAQGERRTARLYLHVQAPIVVEARGPVAFERDRLESGRKRRPERFLARP